MSTLLLIRSEIESLLDPMTLLAGLRQAFIDYSTSPAAKAHRVRSQLPGLGTATVLFPGTTPGVPAYSVKVHAKFPGQSPAIRGVLCLHDVENGELLAVMDSTHLTAVRTGLAGALAADVLACKEADTVAVIGAGVQGRCQLRSFAALRRIHKASVYDVVPERAATFARELSSELGLAVEAAESAAEAVRGAGVVFTATWAREPLILAGMLAPGAHVTTLGPDEPGKAEVAADVIRNALFVCDDRMLAVEMGAIGGVGLGSDAIAAELGEVLAGLHPGRTSSEQVTVYGGVGLAFQDLVAAWAIYQAARLRGVGRGIDFIA